MNHYALRIFLPTGTIIEQHARWGLRRAVDSLREITGAPFSYQVIHRALVAAGTSTWATAVVSPSIVRTVVCVIEMISSSDAAMLPTIERGAAERIGLDNPHLAEILATEAALRRPAPLCCDNCGVLAEHTGDLGALSRRDNGRAYCGFCNDIVTR